MIQAISGLAVMWPAIVSPSEALLSLLKGSLYFVSDYLTSPAARLVGSGTGLQGTFLLAPLNH